MIKNETKLKWPVSSKIIIVIIIAIVVITIIASIIIKVRPSQIHINFKQ